MSCPLLGKLAPETRVMIDGYVLSFDHPLCHATRMKPFGERLIANSNITWFQLCAPGGREANTAADVSKGDLEAESQPPKSSHDRVNTAILVANKLVYSEAISVFYNKNTISFEPQLCWATDLTPLRTSDLSLARHVVAKVEMLQTPNETPIEDIDANSSLALATASRCIPEIFPQLRGGVVYLYTHPNDDAFASRLPLRRHLRQSSVVENCDVDNVGPLIATFRGRPHLKMRVQCKPVMQHWAKCVADPVPDTSAPLAFSNLRGVMSANALRRFEQANPGHFYPALIRRTLHGIMNNQHLAMFFDNVDQDGYEFWTAVEYTLHHFHRSEG